MKHLSIALALSALLFTPACGGHAEHSGTHEGEHAGEADSGEERPGEHAGEHTEGHEGESGGEHSDEHAGEEGGAGASAQLEALRKAVATVAKKAEHVDPKVRVEHILISFAGRRTAATRSQAEAEALAADLLAQIGKGGDFSALRQKNSDDTGGGIYTMTLGMPSAELAREGAMARTGMVGAFGDVGWRLKVGEIGVAGFDPSASPYGWHIIKRVE